MTEESPSLAGRTVLVTGATGLVGSALSAELLARGAKVVAFIRDHDPQSEFFRSGTWQRTRIINGRLECLADVERALAEGEVDGVFHLGAQAIVGTALISPLQTFESNIRGTYHVLEACRRMGDRIGFVVVASSDKAYGSLAGSAYRETDPLAGQGPYDVSKSCTDLLSLSYHRTYGLPVAVTRCGNIFGPGDLNFSRLVPGTILATLQDRPVVIRSDGTFVRDYMYLQDVVEAYCLLAERIDRPGVAGEAFNFAPGRRLSVLEMVRHVLMAMNGEHLEPVIENSARSEIREQVLDASKAHTVLGWQSRYDLAPALQVTSAWYQKYFQSQPMPIHV